MICYTSISTQSPNIWVVTLWIRKGGGKGVRLKWELLLFLLFMFVDVVDFVDVVEFVVDILWYGRGGKGRGKRRGEGS